MCAALMALQNAAIAEQMLEAVASTDDEAFKRLLSEGSPT
jgi:hypothetical protein